MAWNVVEALVAIGVGVVVGSVALVGFGVDSGIEVISAVALLWMEAAQGGAARKRRGARGSRKKGAVPRGRNLFLAGRLHPLRGHRRAPLG